MNSCPTCKELLVFPRGDSAYCEDCGWPDEDFGEEWAYPKLGERLDGHQPNLQFFNEKTNQWQPSGVITATLHENCIGLYRYPLIQDKTK